MLTEELGFNVRLPDLKMLDCTLMGGRLCTLGECRSAYFVVEHDGKPGSLFIMAENNIAFPIADGNRFNTWFNGCDTCIWKNNDQVYAMVW